MKTAPHPFGLLLGLAPARLPQSCSTTLVVNGRRITAAADIVPATGDELADPQAEAYEQARQRAELARVQNAARYQRDRLDPAQMARRKAYDEAHAEERRAYMRAYNARPENLARKRANCCAWAKRNYHADPETARIKARAWYAANRESVLAKKAAKAAATKAAKAAAAAAAPAAPAAAPPVTTTAKRTKP